MSEGSKILITGVAGFIGSNLARRLLEAGYSVLGLDNLAHGVETQVPKGVEFHKLDIRSRDIFPVFKGVDFVFHLAAKNCIPDCEEDPVETSDINITGTTNILEASRKAGVKKIINAESASVYEGTGVFPTPEAEVKPRSFYAVSKFCGSLIAQKYREAYGLNVIGLRYFGVYGPRQDYRRLIPPVISAFIIKLLKREPPIIYGTGHQRKDFVYIDDINDFHLICLKEGVKNDTFNVGSGENYSILELLDLVSSLVGIKIDPIFKPALLEMDPPVNLADISKAKKMGWRPQTSLVDGLKENIAYIKGEFEIGNIK
ncbi:MAG: NAD-dependent epimerase/dehydratase family protein [Patescibacteria group bacterium]